MIMLYVKNKQVMPYFFDFQMYATTVAVRNFLPVQ